MNTNKHKRNIIATNVVIAFIIFLLFFSSFQASVNAENYEQDSNIFPPSPPTCNDTVNIREITKLMQVVIGIIEIPPEKKDLLREKLNKGEDEEIEITVREVIIATRPILETPLSDKEMDEFERVRIIISVICTIEPNNNNAN